MKPSRRGKDKSKGSGKEKEGKEKEEAAEKGKKEGHLPDLTLDLEDGGSLEAEARGQCPECCVTVPGIPSTVQASVSGSNPSPPQLPSPCTQVEGTCSTLRRL